MFKISRIERRHKPKIEFSKKILIFSYFCAGVTFGYAMWMQYMMVKHDFHGDVGIVITLITSSGAMIVSGQGFYSWKTKALNMLKTKLNPEYLMSENDREDEFL